MTKWSVWKAMNGPTGYLMLWVNFNSTVCPKNVKYFFNWFKAWLKGINNLIYSASGDGGIQLWNISNDSSTSPVFCYKEHSQEACSVDCSKNDVGTFISSSWDCTVKLWNALYAKSLSTYQEHSQLVYHTKFSPNLTNTFASVSGDGYLKLWSTNSSTSIITVQTLSPEV